MVRRYDFVDRMTYLIREKLENNLPCDATLDEMMEKAKELLKELFK